MALDYKDYLANFRQRYDMNYRSETWVVTLAIPRDVWDTDNWGSMPAYGAAAPTGDDAYPAGLGVSGTLLDKNCDFKTEPGWVLVTLIYGYAFTGRTVNKGYVITDTIMHEEQITHAYTGSTKTQMVGPKTVTAGNVITQEYDITPGAGYAKRETRPYQLIRIHAFLDADGLNTYVGALLPYSGRLNEGAWTLLGKEIKIEQMKYLGAKTNFYRALTTSTALYTADFDFIVHPVTWQKVVKRTLYTVGTRSSPQWDDEGNIVGQKTITTRKVSSHDPTEYSTYLTWPFSVTLANLLN